MSQNSKLNCVVDDIVSYKFDKFEGTGTVKFVGPLPTKTEISKIWIGVERDTIDPNEDSNPVGFDGKIGDIQYFECTNNAGIFVPYDAVQIIEEKEPSNAEPIDADVDKHTDSDIKPEIQNPISTQTTKPTKTRVKEPVDAMELAEKFKRTVKTETDKRIHQWKTETDKRINQLKRKQSDIIFKLKQRGDALKKKEIRESLNINPNKPRQTSLISLTSSISTRTAQLLQQQKLLSQAVTIQRKQLVTEQLKTEEQLEINFNEEQLKAMEIMSNIFIMQTKQPLDAVMDDIQELQIRQEKCLQNISDSSMWFSKEERQKVNEMSNIMSKVPKYRKKLASMKQRVQDISYKVGKLKRDTNQLKAKIGIDEDY